MEAMDLEFDTDPEAYMPPEPAEPVTDPAAGPSVDAEEEDDDLPEDDTPARLYAFKRDYP